MITLLNYGGNKKTLDFNGEIPNKFLIYPMGIWTILIDNGSIYKIHRGELHPKGHRR